ncbi:MAG: hypothetical protein NTW04_00665 [Elusimicrobia bacterium]|nr:hypothetical protein [Elusimicrobiota bacterium]
MNFRDFRASFAHLPVLPGRIIVAGGNFSAMHSQLNNWQNKGLLIQLKRGLYVLSRQDRKIEPSAMFLAGQLYAPSYISLEYALSFYGLIPEAAVEITSVTAKKTARFANEFGRFSYQHIKREAFRGFKMAKDGSGLAYFIAEPEKAVTDFIYLNLSKFKRGDREVFSQSYRFQNLKTLSGKKLSAYANLYGSGKLADIVKEFCRFIKNHD